MRLFVTKRIPRCKLQLPANQLKIAKIIYIKKTDKVWVKNMQNMTCISRSPIKTKSFNEFTDIPKANCQGFVQ